MRRALRRRVLLRHGGAARGLLAAGAGPGDAVVTSAITFAASANCAAYVGATPRYADIERTTWNVSARTVAAAAEGARAVIPVHFAGLPVDVAGPRAALGGDVAIIEDAAHAAGAASPDGPVGTAATADMAVFSFHPVKAITTGEGGMVTTRDPELREGSPRSARTASRPRPSPTRSRGCAARRSSASTTG